MMQSSMPEFSAASAIETSPARKAAFVLLGVLVLFSGACTLFVGVVTASQAWQEYAQQSWRDATAHVDTCVLTRSSTNGRHRLYIQCRFVYSAGLELNAINVYSTPFPDETVAQYPLNQRQPYDDWLAAHPPGTPVAVRYDPAKHSDAVMVSDLMPRAGPHTPNNLKLLAVCAGIFVVTLVLARIARPRARATNSEMASNAI
jgi:acyl transferase domain-containing protein